MMKYKISVIIPVYNVENYIKDCLDSIVNQSIGIENIEVIIVNDCTPDNSMEIVREYAKNYPSIKILEHEVNQGLGPARNTGLKHATADYISFIDSDDFISENTYEICLKKFEKHECDLVIYEYNYYSESDKKYPRNPSGIIFEQNKLIEDITKIPEIIFSTSSCNKVFPKKLKNILKFPSTRYEDMVVTTNAIFNSKKIYITNECKYYYRKRESGNKSITDDYLENTKSYRDWFIIHYQLHTLLETYPHYKSLIDWINTRDTRFFLEKLMLKKSFSHKDRKDMFHIIKKYMNGVEDITFDKFTPYWAEFLSDVQKKSYWEFFFKYGIYTKKIKPKLDNLILFSKKMLNVLEISILIIISIVYKVSPKYNRIWLICERKNEAKDNGYKFFQYMQKKHPKINSYYLIDKKCKDYNKISSSGNIIHYGSWKHKLLFILSENLICAHKNIIEPWDYRWFKKNFQIMSCSKNYIFLQHGIIGNDVSKTLGKKNPNNYFDLFICGAKPEYDFINNNFGYLPWEAVYTGIARFDYLDGSKTKNQILLMPTWRNGIVQPSWIKEKIVDEKKFLNSEYYKVYQNIINNKKLIRFLEKNDFNLIFYPHYEVQQYIKYFNSRSDRIIIANKDLYDVQTLLIESKLLITDYSSIHFDFAYMNKPLVYYQFDKDYFFTHHYKKGYFSYEKNGFGPVLKTEDKIIDFVKKSFENNFSVDEKYSRRVNEFFLLKDHNNCDRIYNEILKIKNHYALSDNLIEEIFKNYENKFTVQGINVYCHNNFLMYVTNSKKSVNKIWLHVFPKDHDKLENPNTKFNYLDFIFEDFCVTNNTKSKYNNKHIAIVRLPDYKIKNLTTGKIRDRKSNENKLNITYLISILYPFYILYKERINLKRGFINIKAYRKIKKNNLLKKDYYLRYNVDVKLSHMDPILHYIYHGWRENRKPNPQFDGDYYLKKYNDVEKSHLNPLVHYSLYGINEGRKIKKP